MTSLRAPHPKKTSGKDSRCQHCHVQIASLAPEILVVEDGSGLFAKIGAMLQEEGFQILLAPDAATALQELENYDIGAVIAGASPLHHAGLNVLAAAQQKQAGIKTIVVTSLVDPELPLEAYEMDLDDYVHWPLSSSALSGRLRHLLGLGADPRLAAAGPGEAAEDSETPQTLAILDFLVDRFAESLAAISQSLEDIRQVHREGLATQVSGDLLALATEIRYLSTKMHQVRHCQAHEAASQGAAPPRCFH